MYVSKHNAINVTFETFETDYRLETIGMRATVLTVETGK